MKTIVEFFRWKRFRKQKTLQTIIVCIVTTIVAIISTLIVIHNLNVANKSLIKLPPTRTTETTTKSNVFSKNCRNEIRYLIR